MNKLIVIIVLGAFFPSQLNAANFTGFGADTNIEYFVPRGPEKKPLRESAGIEKILEEPPITAAAGDTGTNWWLWGGLAVVVGGVVALGAGGSKGAGSTSSSVGGPATTTVTGSW